MRRAFRMIGVLVVVMVIVAPAWAAPPPDPTLGERYDGRRGSSIVPEALLVPRLLLSPLRLTFAALGVGMHHLLDWEERNHVQATLSAALSSRDGLIGVRPAFQYSSSYTPAVGLRLFDRKLFGPGTNFEVAGLAGSLDVLAADAVARPTRADAALAVDLRAHYQRRDDQLFAGMGPVTVHRPTSRYAVDALDAGGEATLVLSPVSSLALDTGFGLRRFADGRQIGQDRPIATVYCQRVLGHCLSGRVDPVRVPGFVDGTQFLRAGLSARFDSRDNDYQPASGALLELGGDYSHGLGFDHSQYLRAWGTLAAALDLWRRSRVLVVKVAARLLEPLGAAPVPFSELVILGGPDDFRGFRRGLFRDHSSLLFAVEYRWPIWMWMEAALFAEYGGVFGRGFSGFALSRLRPDVGAGVRLRSSDAFYLRAQMAYGWGDGWQFFVSLNAGW